MLPKSHMDYNQLRHWDSSGQGVTQCLMAIASFCSALATFACVTPALHEPLQV